MPWPRPCIWTRCGPTTPDGRRCHPCADAAACWPPCSCYWSSPVPCSRPPPADPPTKRRTRPPDRTLTASAPPSRPPPNAAQHRSPRPRARPAGSTSAGPRTLVPVPPSPPFRTTLACSHPGPAGCMPTRGPAANATHTPPASLPAPGSASSGPAGTPAHRRIPAPTSPNSASRSLDLTQGTQAHRCPPAVPAPGAHRHDRS